MTAATPSPWTPRPDDPLGLLAASASDYGPVPRNRWSQPWSSQTVRVLTVVGALVVGFLLTAGLAAGHRAAVTQQARKSQLVQLVRDRQERTGQLAQQLEELRARVATAESSFDLKGAESLKGAVASMEAAAGLTQLTGPGVRVTFSDAEQACASARPEDCRIQDTDLQLAINDLWALGAEGIAVNGERVVATTAVRNAGSSVLVNYRVMTSPYTIEAVGDTASLREGFLQTDLAADFAVWQGSFGLGMNVDAAEELRLPPYTGSLEMDYSQNLDASGARRSRRGSS